MFKRKSKPKKFFKDLNNQIDWEHFNNHLNSHKWKICKSCHNQIDEEKSFYAEYILEDKNIKYQCEECNKKYHEIRDTIFKEICTKNKECGLYCNNCDCVDKESHLKEMEKLEIERDLKVYE